MCMLKSLVLGFVLCLTLAFPVMAADLVNVNTATMEELAALPNVGAELAADIVEHRENIGDIKKIDELLEVKGVTPEVLEKLRQVLKVEAIEGSDCNC